MRNSRRTILLGVCASAACAGALGGSLPQAARDLQRALEDLRAGRYAEAEHDALTLASDPEAPTPRAWAVVAAARQGRRDFDAAQVAWRRYLAYCDDAGLRAFALRRIRACEAAKLPSEQPPPPSSRLKPDELAELARVGPAVCIESSPHFVVRARNVKLAKLVAREAEVSLARIAGMILTSQEYPHSVEIYVWPTRTEYRTNAADAPEWAGGSFSIARDGGTIIRRIDLTQCDPDGRLQTIMLDRVLPHEMCHLVVQEYFGDSPCPLFLNEGLAMLSEFTTDNERLLAAGAAVCTKDKIPLAELLILERDGVDRATVTVFYAESLSVTEFIRSRLSPEQFRTFLTHVKSGSTVSDALQRTLYMPYSEEFLKTLAGAWQEHALTRAQIIRALRGEPELSFLDEG